MDLKQVIQQGEQDRIVVGHNEQIDTGEVSTGLEIAKWMAQLCVLAAVVDKYLMKNKNLTSIKDICDPTGANEAL